MRSAQHLQVTRALDAFDPACADGVGLAAASAQARGLRLTPVSFTTDWCISPARSREIVQARVDTRIAMSCAETDVPPACDALLLDDARHHNGLCATFRAHRTHEVGACDSASRERALGERRAASQLSHDPLGSSTGGLTG